jgi:NAD(P)-dependent dehydrogenase (short-subunit alcohol dehydrogenase family)
MKQISDQCILVTGSTDGIGKLTALRLARRGATVLLHGRDAEKCRNVKAEIRKSSGNAKLECFTADFSSLPAVRKMAADIAARHPRLDVLVNNAGVLPAGSESGGRDLSEQGYDLCLAVNYLAPFLLTLLLLPCLSASDQARIINVCSAAQERIDFKNLMMDSYYSPMRAYARSKLALAMFTFELNERLSDKNITVNCGHPGTLLDTKMVRQSAYQPHGSAESGADVVAHLATAPELENVSGAYFNQKTRALAHPQAYDLEARRKLWQVSLELVGLPDRSGKPLGKSAR